MTDAGSIPASLTEIDGFYAMTTKNSKYRHLSEMN